MGRTKLSALQLDADVKDAVGVWAARALDVVRLRAGCTQLSRRITRGIFVHNTHLGLGRGRVKTPCHAVPCRAGLPIIVIDVTWQ